MSHSHLTRDSSSISFSRKKGKLPHKLTDRRNKKLGCSLKVTESIENIMKYNLSSYILINLFVTANITNCQLTIIDYR